jgi:hypothetical protein
MQGVRGGEHLPAPAPEERMQGVRGGELLPAPAPEEHMQGVRGGEHLPAPAPEEQMQGVPSANHRGSRGGLRGRGFSLGSHARAAEEAPKNCGHCVFPSTAGARRRKRCRRFRHSPHYCDNSRRAKFEAVHRSCRGPSAGRRRRTIHAVVWHVRAAEDRVACACAAAGQGLSHGARLCRDGLGALHRRWQGADTPQHCLPGDSYRGTNLGLLLRYACILLLI